MGLFLVHSLIMAESFTLDAHAFTLEDWNEIRRLAFGLHEDKEFDGDDFKISIAAFIIWLEMHLEQPSNGIRH